MWHTDFSKLETEKEYLVSYRNKNTGNCKTITASYINLFNENIWVKDGITISGVYAWDYVPEPMEYNCNCDNCKYLAEFAHRYYICGNNKSTKYNYVLDKNSTCEKFDKR